MPREKLPLPVALIFLLLVLASCGYQTLNANDCRNMCYPKGVQKFDKDGCHCDPDTRVLVQAPEKKP